MPHLHSILVYPIKSLEGIPVTSSIITPGGTLQYDREFALLDESGEVVRGKNTPKLFTIRVQYQVEEGVAVFTIPGYPVTACNLVDEGAKIAELLSDYLQKRVRLVRNTVQGFPDDEAASGPTIVALESLYTVQSWFPELSVEELVRRFRVNLIVSDAPAFWEDHLYTTAGNVLPFTVGDVEIHGTNPCARCPVPTRNSYSGEILSGFQKQFAAMRKATLPSWAETSRWDHYYRFTVNTIMAKGQEGKVIRPGDMLTLLRSC